LNNSLTTFLTAVFLLFSHFCFGQFIEIEPSQKLSSFKGDELSPAWSPDGDKLLFHSNVNGNWDIFIYHLSGDSTEQLTDSPGNEKNPVWLKDGKTIVFDSDKSGSYKLYRKNSETKSSTLLFEREIQAREASFSPSEDLVYFSGFDPEQKRWAIYSYEFLYGNLNKLTDLPGNSHSPAVSPDEDHVVFTNTNRNFPFDQLYVMNWYGNDIQLFTDFNGSDPEWGKMGLKVYFVSKKEGNNGQVYSMWSDGSHLEQLTNSELNIKSPAKSPDGKYLAISVKQRSGFDIFLLPVEDY
jgi:TolB protein